MRLLAIALVLLPCAASAQPSPTRAPASQPALLKLPVGTRLTTPQGTFQGYSLAEFKVLLKIEASYRSWGLQVPTYRKMFKDLRTLNINGSKQVELLGSQVTVLKGERDRLTKKWTEENRLRHLCENKPAFGSWLAWGSAAVLGAVAAVLTVILISKD